MMILKVFFFLIIVVSSALSVTGGTRMAREDKQPYSSVLNQTDTTKILHDSFTDKPTNKQSELVLVKEFELIDERLTSLIYHITQGIYDPGTFYGMEENLNEHLLGIPLLVSSFEVHREKIEQMSARYQAIHHSILDSAALMEVYNPAHGPPHIIIYKTIQLKMRLSVFLISAGAQASDNSESIAQIKVLDQSLASWKRAFDKMVNLSPTLHICFYTQYTEAKKIIKALTEQPHVKRIVAEEEVSV